MRLFHACAATSALMMATPLAAQPATPPALAARPTAPLFLFLYSPGPNWRAGEPMARQDLRDHALYHARLVREGRSFAAGGYGGMNGGMAIVRAADRAGAQALLAADPAILNGVFVCEIRAWTPVYRTEAPLVAPGP